MLTFEELSTFIREWAGIPRKIPIAPETLFEEDLGLTGDDGCELLVAVEDHFGVCLSTPEDGYRKAFDLAPHEFLFHSEGLGWGWGDIVGIFQPSRLPSSIRAFTVGELFEAMNRAPAKPIRRVSILGLDALPPDAGSSSDMG